MAGIVKSVCEAIWDCLSGEFMAFPTEAEWRKIAEDFRRMWAFPNCVGAMDGKHVVIEAPPSSGSLYYNYKGTFSIVLLAVVDAHYGGDPQPPRGCPSTWSRERGAHSSCVPGR